MPEPDNDVRKRIVAVTQRITFRRGASVLRMEKLASELGVSTKTLYTHYRSKDNVLDAAMAAHHEHYHAAFRAVLESPDLNFLSRLRQTMHLGWEANSKMTTEAAQDFQRHVPALWHQYELRKHQSIQEHFGRLLAEGQQQGFLREDLRLDIVMDILMDVMTYQLSPNALYQKNYSVQQAQETFYRLMFEGVLNEGARRQYARLA